MSHVDIRKWIIEPSLGHPTANHPPHASICPVWDDVFGDSKRVCDGAMAWVSPPYLDHNIVVDQYDFLTNTLILINPLIF